MMATISLDLRERIITAYDRGEGTRQQIADRFVVSLGMVKKLLQQRRRTKSLAPRHSFSGRKPRLLARCRRPLEKLVRAEPDLTLAELRARLELPCSLAALHYVLAKLGLTYKKRRSARANS